MLLRKKVVAFARLGGKLLTPRFSPSIMDQTFKNALSKYMKFMHHEYRAKISKKRIQFHGKFTSLKSEKCDKTENLQLNQTPSIIQSIEINQISILLR